MSSHGLNPKFFIVFDWKKDTYLLGEKWDSYLRLAPVEKFIFNLIKSSLSQEEIIQKLANEIKNSSLARVTTLKTFSKFKRIGIFNRDQEEFTPPIVNIQFSNGSKLEINVRKTIPAYHWLCLLNFQLSHYPEITNHGYFYGDCFHSQEVTFSQLSSLRDELNEELSKWFPAVKFPEVLKTRESLASIHQVFEEYFLKTKELYRNKAKGLIEKLHLFNHIIHLAEDSLSNSEGGFIEVTFEQKLPPVPFPISDKVDQYFEIEHQENTVYLNYYQIGYSYLSAYEAKSKSVPIPQNHFSSFFKVYLRPTTQHSQTELNKIEEWLKKTHGKNINDPSLRLGHIPIGDLRDATWKDSIKKIPLDPKIDRIFIQND